MSTSFDPIAYINTPRWQQSRLGLERIRDLMALLHNPQQHLKFIHVAGTNGKGSTCAYLATVLHQCGYQTGLFTSPYIQHFEERIRVNGQNISGEDLSRVTLQVKAAAEQLEAKTGDHPTEFELMTAVALLHFAQVGCDIVVLEVGLGGRLDSTNVIEHPEVSVICRLGLDHTALLGNTLAAVATEKAGIIKPGCPVVSYPQDPEAAAVIEDIATQLGAPLTAADFNLLTCDGLRPVEKSHPCLQSQADSKAKSETGPVFALEQGFTYLGQSYSTQLLASYQPSNAALALEVLKVLESLGWVIPPSACQRGITLTQWPGRFELLPTHPAAIVDGGHNPQGAQALADALTATLPVLRQAGATGPVVLLVGLLADKDYPAMLATVAPFAQAVVATQPPNPRALAATDLAAAFAPLTKAPIEVCPHPADAVATALKHAGPDGLVVAFGSLYQVGQIKELLLQQVCQTT